MDFRDAANRLGRSVTSEELARALGVSLYTIRQARLQPDAAGYRPPPKGWQAVLARMAEERGGELHELAKELRRESD